MTVEFYLNYKITGADSLNAIYSGGHWNKRKGYAEKIHMIARNALSRAGERRKFRNPVCVTIAFPKDRIDIDNHGYFSKCVIDALKGVIINDDNYNCVRALVQTFEQRKNIRVTVEEMT